MVAAGVPERMDNHAGQICRFAKKMINLGRAHSISDGNYLKLRVGIACGPVVAGVIGKRKFAFDIWGDTVNLASRLESSGEAGKIHVNGQIINRLFLITHGS